MLKLPSRIFLDPPISGDVIAFARVDPDTNQEWLGHILDQWPSFEGVALLAIIHPRSQSQQGIAIEPVQQMLVFRMEPDGTLTDRSGTTYRIADSLETLSGPGAHIQ